MTSRLIMAMLLTAFLSTSMNAQQLLSPFFAFSYKKTSYVTLTDGTELTGRMKNAKYKKGLIQEIRFEPDNGEKMKIPANKIASMYLPPSGFEKFSKQWDTAFDMTKYGTGIDKEIVEKGYIYYEQVRSRVGKKEMVVLMQLLNPHFSDGVRIYFDPWAKETTSVGIGGFNVAGGDAKSYYLRKGDAVAYKVRKKDYDDEFPMLYKGCDAVDMGDKKKPRWLDLAQHVYTYNEECGEQ